MCFIYCSRYKSLTNWDSWFIISFCFGNLCLIIYHSRITYLGCLLTKALLSSSCVPDTVATKGFSLHIPLAGEPHCLRDGRVRTQPQIPRLALLTSAQVKRWKVKKGKLRNPRTVSQIHRQGQNPERGIFSTDSPPRVHDSGWFTYYCRRGHEDGSRLVLPSGLLPLSWLLLPMLGLLLLRADVSLSYHSWGFECESQVWNHLVFVWPPTPTRAHPMALLIAIQLSLEQVSHSNKKFPSDLEACLGCSGNKPSPRTRAQGVDSSARLNYQKKVCLPFLSKLGFLPTHSSK